MRRYGPPGDPLDQTIALRLRSVGTSILLSAAKASWQDWPPNPVREADAMKLAPRIPLELALDTGQSSRTMAVRNPGSIHHAGVQKPPRDIGLSP